MGKNRVMTENIITNDNYW